MKQVNFGALVRITVLATLLGTPSYAQELDVGQTDEQQVDESTADDSVKDDGTEGLVSVDETSVGTSEIIEPEIAICGERTELPTMAPPEGFCDSNQCYFFDSTIVVDPISVDETEVTEDPVDGTDVVAIDDQGGEVETIDWVKRDDVVVDDGVDLFATAFGGNPQVWQTLAGSAVEVDLPVSATGKSKGTAVLERSAVADGRVLCLLVPKAQRNGHDAFDLCQP